MSQSPLTEREHRETIDAIREHGTIEAAALAVGINRSTFDSRWRRARAWALASDVEVPRPSARTKRRAPVIVEPSPRLPVSADECWALLDSFIGRTRKPIKRPTQKPITGTQRLVIASDFHAPFVDAWAVAELIAREARQTDTLILAGDVQDFYAISRFVKYEHVPIAQELAAVDALLGQLSAAFPDILVIAGNHDHARFEKQMRTLLSPDMCHVIEYLTGGNLSVIQAIARRYPNIRFVGHQVERHHVSWFTQVGDLLVAHAEKFSRVPGSALRSIEEWFADQEDALGLEPWRVVAQAHTHQLGIFPFRADKLLCEVGCFSETHGYMLQARVGGRPQRRGYMKCEQTKGLTDINSVRLVWLDAERKAA